MFQGLQRLTPWSPYKCCDWHLRSPRIPWSWLPCTAHCAYLLRTAHNTSDFPTALLASRQHILLCTGYNTRNVSITNTFTDFHKRIESFMFSTALINYRGKSLSFEYKVHYDLSYAIGTIPHINILYATARYDILTNFQKRLKSFVVCQMIGPRQYIIKISSGTSLYRRLASSNQYSPYKCKLVEDSYKLSSFNESFMFSAILIHYWAVSYHRTSDMKYIQMYHFLLALHPIGGGYHLQQLQQLQLQLQQLEICLLPVTQVLKSWGANW